MFHAGLQRRSSFSFPCLAAIVSLVDEGAGNRSSSAAGVGTDVCACIAAFASLSVFASPARTGMTDRAGIMHARYPMNRRFFLYAGEYMKFSLTTMYEKGRDGL
jgi:hypothetical protein